VQKLLDAIDQQVPEIFASGMRGSAGAFFIALLSARLRRHVLVIAPTWDRARGLYDELVFYRGMQGGTGPQSSADVLFFPSLDSQPYENVLSHCDISAQRLWTLYRLCESDQPCITVTSVQPALQRLVPHDILIDAICTVSRGDEIDREFLCARLIEGGYARVGLVEDRGDISIRGEVMDVFPPGFEQPVRIDFFGDTVESIRLFDTVSQRSNAELPSAVLVPVREVILSTRVIDDFTRRVQEPAFAALFDHGKGISFARSIQDGFLPSGVEYSLSYLYPHCATLFDYLPEDTVVFYDERNAVQDELTAFHSEVAQHYRTAVEEQRVVSPPEDLFIAGLPDARQQVLFERWAPEKPGASTIGFATAANDDVRGEMIDIDSHAGALSEFAGKIEQWCEDGVRVFIVCHTKTQCERLRELLGDYSLEATVSTQDDFPDTGSSAASGTIHICVGTLSQGFRYDEGLLCIITEEEIFGEKKRRIAAPRHRQGVAISDFSDLSEGDFIVHRDNGIGMYRGLKTLEAGGACGDYLSLEYIGNDKLYVPIAKINLINKYEGAEDTVPRLDKLGGTSWQRAKKRVRDAVEKIANDLIQLYSARKVYTGHAFSPPDHYFHEFEAAFPYEETPDQLGAIDDVMRDMSGEMPMDRLICGDVGYGKTEVALRAAFRVVMDGKQAAILVPTTVLAQQHYQTFSERFAGYPVTVDMLSRFRSTRDRKETLDDLAAGKVDIIIGTHRLIQKDVVFKRLGLLVIDEEHRFGVKHKERIKKMRTTVDVLTLTATPIPRTLQFSLLGIRDFSLIETPPEDRLSIRTIITQFEEGVIKEAVIRELKRGGQIFFVHNRVKSIDAMALYLKRIVPEVRLGIAHGQMKEKELEEAMMKFVTREIDMLLCTTIIESGLDFPTANTIIINNAHRLGLAQMYQLRGRVGRGKVRAYAYMLVPGKNILSRDALKRLEALSEFTELGAGYRLATRDLQIRGAGNMLGHSQSGQIAAVGLDLYLDILNETIHKLRGEKAPVNIDPEINLNIQAYIPQTYVSDINQRLVLYRRFAAITTDDEIMDLEEELRDRFGKPPGEVENLLATAGLKNLLRTYLIASVDCTDREIIFSFHEDAGHSLDKILALVAEDEKRYRLTPDHKLIAQYNNKSDIILEIKKILK